MQKILWLLPDKSGPAKGVYLYNEALIKIFSSKVSVSVLSVRADRSILRYVEQFIFLPIRVLFYSGRFDFFVIPQESYSYLCFFAKLSGVKSVLIYHHVTDSKAKGSVFYLKELYLKICDGFAGMSEKIITVSKCSADDIIEKLKVNNVSVIYNPIDFAVDSSASFEKSASVKSMLIISSNEPRKNLEVFLEAFQFLKEQGTFKAWKIVLVLKLVLPMTEKLKFLIDALGDGIDIHHDVTSGKLSELFTTSHVFCAPSLHEGFGRTPIEAQFFGLPVIASNIPVFKETLGGSAIMVDNPINVQSWIESLSGIENVDLSIWIEKGKVNASRFNGEKVSAQVNSFMKDLVDGKG